MRVITKNADGKPIKEIKINMMEMCCDVNYPSVIQSDIFSLVLMGTEDQFKSFISMIIRDLESDRDDPFTNHYKKCQPNHIIS